MGAGIAGLCLARELALRGAKTQLIRDPGEAAASRVASGLLQTAGGRMSLAHLALRQACREGYRDFLVSLDPALELRQSGHLRLGSSAAGRASFAATLRGLGVEARVYEGEEFRSLAPSVRADGAVWLADAAVDPVALLDALEASLARLGVRQGEARIVEALDGALRDEAGVVWRADCVALACGSGLSSLLTAPWSFREEVGWGGTYLGRIALDHSLEALGQTLVPMSAQRWRIGGAEKWGGDPPLKALIGWQGCSSDLVRGVRCATPDGWPVAGQWSRGLYVLGGLGRNGLLTAPLLASGLARQMITGVMPSWLGPFCPLRPHIGHRRSWSR